MKTGSVRFWTTLPAQCAGHCVEQRIPLSSDFAVPTGVTLSAGRQPNTMNFTEFRICRSHWSYTLHSRLDVDEHLCTPWAIDVENPDKQGRLCSKLPLPSFAAELMND